MTSTCTSPITLHLSSILQSRHTKADFDAPTCPKALQITESTSSTKRRTDVVTTIQAMSAANSNSNLGEYPSNVPAHPLLMNCVFAISGTYGLLPRVLYYVTLVFAIFGRHREWLIIGALVTAMTYAGTTSIHQMALVTSRTGIYDLDIMGAWAILSTGALAYIAMMHWSSTLRDSHARVIFIIWGIILGIGLIFGRSEIFSTPLSEPEPACYSSQGTLLIYPIELVGSGSGAWNCTYKCFSNTKPMRQPQEVMVVPRQTLKNKYSDLSVVLIGPIQFVAYAALSLDTMRHSPSRTCTWIVLKYLEPKHHERLYYSILDASDRSWYGGYFTLWHFARRTRWSFLKVALFSFTIPWFMLGVIVDVLALPMLVINIVLNEITINSSQLPTNEANYAIGQWGPWVSSVLVVFATLLHQVLVWRDRVKVRKQRATAAEARRKNSSQTLYEAQADVEEQTMGVVPKPSLAHAVTLQDLHATDTEAPRRGKRPVR